MSTSRPLRLLALGPLLLLAQGAAGLQACASSSECTANQYCSSYESETGVSSVACYPCVDSYRYTCTEYGDSIDSCAQCADDEALNDQDEYSYINCESSAACGDSMYCYMNDNDGFVVQDCWPCSDSNGNTCADYGDEVNGNCDKCIGALPMLEGCTSHVDCTASQYCSEYQNSAATNMIVTCSPCLDTYGYTCSDYGDSIDGRCAVCAGAEFSSSPPSPSYEGPPSQCINPSTTNPTIMFQSCAAQSECRPGEYCSSYMGSAGCVIDCYPCTDMYGLTCADYNDPIDGSCSVCAASASGSSTAPRAVNGNATAAIPISAPATTNATMAGAPCVAHTDCTSSQFCEKGAATPSALRCAACGGAAACTGGKSFDGNCTRCTTYAAMSGVSTGSSEVEMWKMFAVGMVVFVSILAVIGSVVYAVKKMRAKYGKDDNLTLRNRGLRENRPTGQGLSSSDDFVPHQRL